MPWAARWRPRHNDLPGDALKALLKLLFASGGMAAAVGLVLAVQNFATYSSFAPLVQNGLPKAKFVPQVHIYGVSIDAPSGRVTMTLTPFTSRGVAVAIGKQYGMDLIGSSPAFGQYVFSLPQIKIGAGPSPHTATVYFPPFATTSDISNYLTHNGLQVATWTSTDDTTGRVAVVELPQITPVLIDAANGIYRASVPAGIDRSRLDDWAKTNGVQIISYDSTTGTLLIQGPKPKPVLVRTVVRRPATTSTTTTPAPQTVKLYIAFKPGTTFSQAQQAVQSAGGQITSFDSSTELGIATVTQSQLSPATASLTNAAQVNCVSQSSTACPSTVSGSTSTQPSPSPSPSGDGSSPSPAPSTTTSTGTGWTTTVVPSPTPTTTVALQLTATPMDGHVSLTWTAVTGAQSYQVMRSDGGATPTLVATTNATSLTDVGGTTGTQYTYTIAPVLSSGPDSTQAQTATALWVAAQSTPVLIASSPSTSTLSGSVSFTVSARTGDGAGSASWSLVSSAGATTQMGNSTAAPLTTDPLTWTAGIVWDSRAVLDGTYTLVVTMTDGSGHSTQTASTVKVSNAAPAAPTSLGATTVGTTVVLTWRQPASANGAAYLVQKDGDIKPVAAIATGSLSWADQNAGTGAHTYTVVLEDQYGNESNPVSASVTVSNAAVPVNAPGLTLVLPNGQRLAQDGAVDDRLLLVTDATTAGNPRFEYATDNGLWTRVPGTMSCSPQCTLDWNVSGFTHGHYAVRVVTNVATSLAQGFVVRGDHGLPAPSAPSALITPFGVSLTWSPSAGELATRYAVSRRHGSSWLLLARVDGTSYLDTQASPGANDYRVQAYDGDGAIGDASAMTTIIVPEVARNQQPASSLATRLAAPTGVHAVTAGSTVTLLWDPVAGATGYVVERAWQIDGQYEQAGRTGETVFRDSTAIGAVAFYKVLAFNVTQGGTESDVVSAAVIPTPTTSAASPFVLASGSSATSSQAAGTITLGTTQSSGSAGAQLQVIASGTASATPVSVQVQQLQSSTWYAVGQLSALTSGSTWTADGTVITSGLSEGAHQIRAVALSANGTVVGTTAASTLTVVHTASATTGVAAAVTGQTVTVTWNANPGSTYNVYRGVAGGSLALAASDVTGTSFVDASLSGGQSTSYAVTSVDVFGNESAFSQVESVITPIAWNTIAPAITILTPNAAERPDEAIIDLAAAVAANAGLANIDFSIAPTGSGAWSSIRNLVPSRPSAPPTPGGALVGGAATTTWTTTFSTAGLLPGRYDLRVTATDAAGRSAQQTSSLFVGAADARGPPATGFNLSATPSPTGIHLTWTGAPGDVFQVRRSFGALAGFVSLASTTSTSYDDSAVLPGSSYSYQVVRLSPALAFTAINSATAKSSFDASGQVKSSDGSLGVAVGSDSADKLALAVTPSANPPALAPNMTTAGAVYDVNATSLATGAAVHQLDQPATLTFAVPAGMTEAQAQGLSVFHWDEASRTWVREPTTLDWAHRVLIATVTHFSTFTITGTSDT
ncbi:MAG TPA: hypothetical protein VFR33_06185, partial [Candidatus Dormibacteraeota bacterium]|nr:hypothetical protein [Candidatus Dormibacteraeota bacterium]